MLTNKTEEIVKLKSILPLLNKNLNKNSILKQKSRKQAHYTFEPNDTGLIKAELNFFAEKIEISLTGKKLFSFDHILPIDF